MFRVGNWNYWSWIMFVAAKPVQYVASQVLFVCVYYFWYFFYIFGIIARRCVRLAMPVNTAVITGGGVHPTGVSARFSGYPRYSGASETLLDSCQYCACHCTTYCYVCVCRCYPECHDTVEVALFPLSPPLLRTRCSHFPLHC